MAFFEKYLSFFIGIVTILIFIILTELKLIQLTSDQNANRLVSLFTGITATLIIDTITRKKEIKSIIREELKENLNDNSKVIVFQNSDEAYDYLAKKIPKASIIRNTIIHKEAYSEKGIKPFTKFAQKYNENKHNLIKSGSVYWEEIISKNYEAYVENVFLNYYKQDVTKYVPFILDSDIDIFQNFTIIEYSSGFSEVLIGWVVTYDLITSSQKCYLISNQDIVSHYKEYFTAIQSNKSRRYIKS